MYGRSDQSSRWPNLAPTLELGMNYLADLELFISKMGR